MKIKIPRLNLRTKFIGAILIVVVLFGSLNIFFNRQSTYKTLENELEKRSLFLAQNYAERNTRLLLFEDMISVQLLLDGVIKSNPDVSYAFIVDKQNNVIAHTFGNTFPVELLNANTIEQGESYHFQLIADEKNNLYRDVMVPILDRKLGYFRLGIAEKNLAAITNKVTLIITGMVLGFLIIGICGAFVFSYWITNPISKIVNALENINLNEKFEPLRVQTKDEINDLANKFNEMAFRLQKTHADLNKAQIKLIRTEKLASVGTLVSGLTHEISSPLAGLKNCLIRLKKNPQKEQFIRYYGLMMNAIQKIENVVGGLLNFSRQDDYNFKPFNPHETINRALALVEYKLEKSGVEVEKNFDEKIKTCVGDSLHIEQVIINLILNAIDAMPRGGTLSVFSFCQDSVFSLVVKDTGTGIPSDCINKIFDPFYTTKEPGKGTGLGLSVSYSIIQEHGGDISVESEVDKGTKFTVSLPLNQNREE
jgi:two-component system NtrC family sensor kinase